VTNLYFNQFLDLDLSEQDALSCSGAGNCDGGWPGETLDYFQSTGVVDETCFAYSATDQSCSNKCSSPDELIKISGKISFGSSSHPKTDDTLKRMIIENGPISGGIRTLLHAMTLVGFKDSEGKTIWIFKNSWGDRWGGKLNGKWGGDGQGNNGYAHVKLDISNIGWTHAIQTPIISSSNYSINCEDNDGDQYCNWGISKNKPSTCPSFCKAQPDCDDSNPSAGPFDANYNCGTTPPPPAEQQFTIHNDGNSVLSVTSITPETSAPWISISTPTPFDVSPGSSKPVSVRVDFSQAPAEQRTTRLLVSSNDPDENPFPNGINIIVGNDNIPDDECTAKGNVWVNGECKPLSITTGAGGPIVTKADDSSGTSNAKFSGGWSEEGGPYKDTITYNGGEVTITQVIRFDPAHVGEEVDIIILLNLYLLPPSDIELWYQVSGTSGFVMWDESPTTIEAFETHTIVAGESKVIGPYNLGVLEDFPTSDIKFDFGYRTNNGTIITTGVPTTLKVR